jgi:Methyltransferase domain
MNRDKELGRLMPWAEKARGFAGWDLSSIKPRLIDIGPPWNYEQLVREYSVGKNSALDLGTGGGEFLSRLRQALPRNVVATEEWKVNAPIANHRLKPTGIGVARCRSLTLPFRSSAFDLVLDRHEELDPSEVARVLSAGGHVVTQQVGDNWKELNRFFPRRIDFSGLYEDYCGGFELAGLKIVRRGQHHYRVAYRGLGELVYLLTIAPWEVSGFSVEGDLDALLALESEFLTSQGLVLTENRFLILAQKIS